MNQLNNHKLKSWKYGSLPDKTAIFVIGDIHGEYQLLNKILREITKKIYKLSKNIKKEIIFIGDYIDRGLNSKKTISMIIDLKKKYSCHKNIKINFICGNHDEFFSKLIFSNGIIPKPNDISFKNDSLKQLVMSPLNYIYISGFKAWYYIGGGRKTIEDYFPKILKKLDHLLITIDGKPDQFPDLNYLINKFKNKIPYSHIVFFKNIVKNYYLILGNYLFVHAGVNPKKTLKNQGIGNKSISLNEYQFVELLMIRDPFLWADTLEKCPYYVIHGHTPSEHLKHNITIADGFKKFRLCLDTKVYKKNGSLTCFFKFKNTCKFISVSKRDYNIKLSYKI